MDALEYRTILAQLGLTQDRAAQLLGVSLRCAHSYANGAHIPEPVARLLLAHIEKQETNWKRHKMVAVKVGVGPTIMLRSGAWFDFCAPESSEFNIDDIAHGLGNICRYSGQCSRFYSVAEHSILVSETAEGFEFEALMHDAAEAFLGDITRPLKQMLPEYKRIEAAVEHAILKRFRVDTPLPPQVKQADLRVLAAEQKQIMPEGTDGWVRGQKVKPAPIVVRHLPPDQAKRAFLDRYEALQPAYLLRKAQEAAKEFSGGLGGATRHHRFPTTSSG